MKPLIQLRKTTPLLATVLLLLACFAMRSAPSAFGVVPPPDGGYLNFNTAEGQNALFSLTTGAANTAVGWFSLWSNAEGSFNTATGAGALLFNTAEENTAFGTAALLFNTTGSGNTATGAAALLNNTTGGLNTGVGSLALGSNTSGFQNTAVGRRALGGNTEGDNNTAVGHQALHSNVSGNSNTVLGKNAGYQITGSGNVCIGFGVEGQAGVDDTTWIANVYASVATARQVYVNSDNKMGTLSSSRRYKEEIKPISDASEAIFALKPVTFRYKKQIDPTQAFSFGLIAEEVAEISPTLITRDKDGKPETVRYEAVNAMLLNEFLKEHRRNEKQEAIISQLKQDFAEQQKQIEALTAGLQRVSAQLELSKAAPQTVLNDQ